MRSEKWTCEACSGTGRNFGAHPMDPYDDGCDVCSGCGGFCRVCELPFLLSTVQDMCPKCALEDAREAPEAPWGDALPSAGGGK